MSQRIVQLQKIIHPFSQLKQEPHQAILQIISKQAYNHDSYLFKFKFITNRFQLTIGQHFRIIQNIKTIECPEGEEVVRKYTPITPCPEKGFMEVLIKIYRPDANPKFPNGGKMTPYLQSLGVGDQIKVEGPYGKFFYQPGGFITADGEPKLFKRIFMIAGGSGITPCYQVLNEICHIQDQSIQLVLLFANKKQQDILLFQELESLKPRVTLHYTLESHQSNWTGFDGYPTQKMLQQICPLDDPLTLYIHCGPFAMNKAIKEIFKKAYPLSKLFKF